MFKVKCYDIDYCFESEDIEDFTEDYGNDLDDDEAMERLIDDVKDRLPKEVILNIDCEEDELDDDLIVDELTDETGWLINSYSYNII
jgi:hypothetical protein